MVPPVHTVEFFDHYHGRKQQLAEAGDTKFKMDQITERVKVSTGALADSEKELAQIRKKMPERRKLIKETEQSSILLNPQLWFRGGLEGKIQRQQTKLAKEEKRDPELVEEISGKKRALVPLTEEKKRCIDAHSQSTAWKQEVEDMYESANKQFPSPQMQEVIADLKEATDDVTFNEKYGKILKEMCKKAKEALKNYEEAQKLQVQAANDNVAAMAQIMGSSQKLTECQDPEMREGLERRHKALEKKVADERSRSIQNMAKKADAGGTKYNDTLPMMPPEIRMKYQQMCLDFKKDEAKMLSAEVGGKQQSNAMLGMVAAGSGQGNATTGMMMTTMIQNEIDGYARMIDDMRKLVTNNFEIYNKLSEDVESELTGAKTRKESSEKSLETARDANFQQIENLIRAGGQPFAAPPVVRQKNGPPPMPAAGYPGAYPAPAYPQPMAYPPQPTVVVQAPPPPQPTVVVQSAYPPPQPQVIVQQPPPQPQVVVQQAAYPPQQPQMVVQQAYPPQMQQNPSIVYR
mmetsp:Transcript_3075/g.3434  ORF Transcript_3075/g.3434 Transcript_3075/m.3434 type:complete len:518 (-) Transcript_3075:558-2111(-)|eukprot:CAMPEP_0197846818 /NCGR_PEP_ID=MMETSP1438-20131217/4479_1 /TAXON_ID=1461541 /ORGANISM="Pterosperma sp., Strain CCMP1384" /LENGTH=517 /DNA_ID=CAMNT_0043458593 /DNA_START=145 /DNA_END=1698 /DNA_ORIENTATION=+